MEAALPEGTERTLHLEVICRLYAPTDPALLIASAEHALSAEHQEKEETLRDDCETLAQENGLQKEMLSRLQANQAALSLQLNDYRQKYDAISGAFFWRITKPARQLSSAAKKVLSRNERIKVSLIMLKRTLKDGSEKAREWRREYELLNSYSDEISKAALQKQQSTHFKHPVIFSILTPLYNTPRYFLTAMLNSVLAQTYGQWELCLADGSDEEHAYVEEICRKYARKDSRVRYQKLKENGGISANTNACIDMSSGDYFAVLDHDDVLHPSALFEVMNTIDRKGADFIYTDESTFHHQPSDAYLPHYKPDYAPDTLRGNNYICHLSVFSRKLLEEAGKYYRSEFDGSQDHDMILRLTEKASSIVHIPKILYYWRSHPGSVASDSSAKEYASAAGCKAVEAHLKRIGLEGTVEPSAGYTFYRVHYRISGSPLVSIIIPNMDHLDDLDQCIDSIRTKTSWENWEIVIVENNSRQHRTFAYYRKITAEDPRISIVTCNQSKFNFPQLCQAGVQAAKGDYLLLLNNDTEVISSDWIEQMLMFAQRPDVGAVGAMLYYPDNTVQHAGVILGIGGIAGHAHKYLSRGDFGYMARMTYAQNLSAVTGACMMLRRDVWKVVKGMDPSFAVAFNDIDLCIRIRKAGYLIVWTPYAELYHYESKSRGKDNEEVHTARFVSEVSLFQKKWADVLRHGDPYYNPNLTLDKEDFSPRKLRKNPN